VRLWRGEEPSQFIFDLMELERPNIDRAVLEFVKGHVFDPADFWNSQTTFVGLIRKWCGWSWRTFPHRKSLESTGPESTNIVENSEIEVPIKSRIRVNSVVYTSSCRSNAH
jgi:hypothetical protein